MVVQRCINYVVGRDCNGKKNKANYVLLQQVISRLVYASGGTFSNHAPALPKNEPPDKTTSCQGTSAFLLATGQNLPLRYTHMYTLYPLPTETAENKPKRRQHT